MFVKIFLFIWIAIFTKNAFSSAKPAPGNLLEEFIAHPNAFNGERFSQYSSKMEDSPTIVKRQQNPDDNLSEVSLQRLISDLEDVLVETAYTASDKSESISSDESKDKIAATPAEIAPESRMEDISDTTMILSDSQESSITLDSTSADRITETPIKDKDKDLKEVEEELKEKVAEIEAEPVILSARV